MQRRSRIGKSRIGKNCIGKNWIGKNWVGSVQVDEKLRNMLEQLSRSLFEAISESEDVHHHLKRLREEGYSLNLLLDCQPEDDEDGEDGTRPSRVPRGALPPGNPTFRINGEDLAFLKSVGIDPTRRCKGRRRAKSKSGSGEKRSTGQD